MGDEMQASLLLCSLSNNWRTFVVTINNFVPNNALFVELVKENLFSEETRNKAYDTENAHALIIESRERNMNREQKGHDKFEGRSQFRDKIKCFHCGKNGI